SNGTFTGITGQNTAGTSAPAPSGLTITAPAQGAVVPWGPAFAASVSYPTTLQVSGVSYYINGGLAGVSNQPPFTALLNPQGHGVESLKAVATTPNGSIEADTTFSVQ